MVSNGVVGYHCGRLLECQGPLIPMPCSGYEQCLDVIG